MDVIQLSPSPDRRGADRRRNDELRFGGIDRTWRTSSRKGDEHLSVHPLIIGGIGKVDLTVTEVGAGRPFLLLHGGAGPRSFIGFGELLARKRPALVITPTHPGFNGTPRPEGLTSIVGLARTYAALLDELQIFDVTVVGNSIGGWIAAELALLDTGRIGGVVLVDGVGLEVIGHPIADTSKLSIEEVSRLSYHDPERFRIDLSTLPPEQRKVVAANHATLTVFSGQPPGVDPSLRERLQNIDIPSLVLWGESDRVVDPDYGRAYAAAIPNAKFQLLPNTGHLPQIETPDKLLEAIWEFSDIYSPTPQAPNQRMVSLEGR